MELSILRKDYAILDDFSKFLVAGKWAYINLGNKVGWYTPDMGDTYIDFLQLHDIFVKSRQ